VISQISAGHPFGLTQSGGFAMGAVSQQGSYLGTTLVGFTAFSGGLVAGGGMGMIVAVAGAILLIVSAAGFISIKKVGS
jgi:hypothetical protein